MQAYYICQNYCYCNEHESDYGEFCITSLKITCWGQPLCLRVTTWRRILWISSFCDWEVNCTPFRTVTQAHAKCVSWCVTLLCNSLRFLLPFLISCITSNVKTCWCHTKYLPETTFPHSYVTLPNRSLIRTKSSLLKARVLILLLALSSQDPECIHLMANTCMAALTFTPAGNASLFMLSGPADFSTSIFTWVKLSLIYIKSLLDCSYSADFFLQQIMVGKISCEGQGSFHLSEEDFFCLIKWLVADIQIRQFPYCSACYAWSSPVPQ